MSGFEYKVLPAPVRGLKAKGVKGTQARFANALETVMNELGAEGWEYQRTDTLPVEERQGLTGKTSSFQNMLVFRRVLVDDVEDAPVVAALLENRSDVAPEAPALEIAEADAVSAAPAPAPAPTLASVAAPHVVAAPAPVVAAPAPVVAAPAPTTTLELTTADAVREAPAMPQEIQDTDTSDARDRVAETLKARAFAFPWDRRSRKAATGEAKPTETADDPR